MTATEIISTALTGIITVAIIAVIVSKRSTSATLISGFSGTLASVIKAAVGQGQPAGQPQITPNQGIGTPAAGMSGINPPGLQ
jgi:PRD1 phage membrane DNA delivery